MGRKFKRWAALFCLAAPRVAEDSRSRRGALSAARRTAEQLQLAGLQGPRLSRASQARLEAYLGSKPALAAAPGSTWRAQEEGRPSSSQSESVPPSQATDAIEDLARHFGQLAISRGSWGSTRSAQEAETCSPRSPATCNGRASRLEGGPAPAREEGPHSADDAPVAVPAGLAEVSSGSEGDGGSEARRQRPVQRRGTLVRRASTGVIVLEQEEEEEAQAQGGAAGLESGALAPDPRPPPRQRLMTGVCAHHHTSLSRLKSQMGNVGGG